MATKKIITLGNLSTFKSQCDSTYATKSELPTNPLTYSSTGSYSVAGTTKTTYTYAQTTIYAPNGLIMGGTAAAAGLVTRGVCGVSSPTTGGACTKENLYINYDSDNTYRSNRQLVLQAGSVGTHYGNNLYQYAAARGDAVKGWVEAQGYAKTNASNSFSGTQTFTGGIDTTGISLFDSEVGDNAVIQLYDDAYILPSASSSTRKFMIDAYGGSISWYDGNSDIQFATQLWVTNQGYLTSHLTSVNGLSGGTISSTTTINGDMIASYVKIASIGHETTSSYNKHLTLSSTNYVRYRTTAELKSDLGIPSGTIATTSDLGDQVTYSYSNGTLTITTK